MNNGYYLWSNRNSLNIDATTSPINAVIYVYANNYEESDDGICYYSNYFRKKTKQKNSHFSIFFQKEMQIKLNGKQLFFGYKK